VTDAAEEVAASNGAREHYSSVGWGGRERVQSGCSDEALSNETAGNRRTERAHTLARVQLGPRPASASFAPCHSPPTPSDARIHLASHPARRRRLTRPSRCAQLLSHSVLGAFLLDHPSPPWVSSTAFTPSRSLCSLLGSPNASGISFDAFEHEFERNPCWSQAKRPSYTATLASCAYTRFELRGPLCSCL
jgi:hypothetical protein